MSGVKDITTISNALFAKLKSLHTENKESRQAVVVHKPKASKGPGNALNAVVLHQRALAGGKGTSQVYTLLVLGNFAPTDVNPATGNFMTPDLMNCFVFEKHAMNAEEIEKYKAEHGGSAGKREYSDAIKVDEMAIRSMTFIEVQNFSPWKIDEKDVAPGDYVRCLNLRREISSKEGRTYNNFVCEMVSSFEVTDYQRLSNLGRIEAARTIWKSMQHTPQTESLPIPEELTAELQALGTAGSKYRIRDLNNEVRWHQATAHQKALMERGLAIPLQGLGDHIGMRFGTMMEPVHFATERSEFKDKNGDAQVIVDLMGTTFVTQIQGDEAKRAQLNIQFNRDATARIGICHAPNLYEFAPRLLKSVQGIIWGSLNPMQSTNASPSVDENGQPLANYALWVDVKLMDFDLAAAVVQTGIEITEEAARKIVSQSDQRTLIEKNKDKHPLRFGARVYEATGSNSGIDSSMYTYFLFHPDLDETRKERLEEIKTEKKLSDKDAVTALSAYLFNNAPDGVFKSTDFKRLQMNANKLCTVFGVKITEVERVKKGEHGLGEEELLELFDEQQSKHSAPPAAAPLAIAAPPALKDEDDASEKSESKKRKGRGGGGASKKVKTAGAIEAKKLAD